MQTPLGREPIPSDPVPGYRSVERRLGQMATSHFSLNRPLETVYPADLFLGQPAGKYFYSNCGYGIAGHMVETITEKPWSNWCVN